MRGYLRMSSWVNINIKSHDLTSAFGSLTIGALRDAAEHSCLSRTRLSIHNCAHSTEGKSLFCLFHPPPPKVKVTGAEKRNRQKEGLAVSERRCWRCIIRLVIRGFWIEVVLLKVAEVGWVLWELVVTARSWYKFFFRWKHYQCRPAWFPQSSIKQLTLKGQHPFMKDCKYLDCQAQKSRETMCRS